MDTGTLPADWLKANVSPVFKKGNQIHASNYRPISLTSICCAGHGISNIYHLGVLTKAYIGPFSSL